MRWEDMERLWTSFYTSNVKTADAKAAAQLIHLISPLFGALETLYKCRSKSIPPQPSDLWHLSSTLFSLLVNYSKGEGYFRVWPPLINHTRLISSRKPQFKTGVNVPNSITSRSRDKTKRLPFKNKTQWFVTCSDRIISAAVAGGREVTHIS